jgi:hypothetical protein
VIAAALVRRSKLRLPVGTLGSRKGIGRDFSRVNPVLTQAQISL